MLGVIGRTVLCALALGAARGAAFEYRGAAGTLSASGYLEGQAIVRTDPDTQRERPQALWDLRLTADPHRTVRLFLETRTLFGGPPEQAGGFGAFNLSDTFQNISPSVQFAEAWIDWTLPHADVRVGLQKFAWGRLDRFQPTDVLNPRDYTDPFLAEEGYAKLGTPALKASYYPPAGGPIPADTSLTLVWIPVPFPVLFPLDNQRWFPPAINANGSFVAKAGSFGMGFPAQDTTINFSDIETRNRRPPQQLDEGAVGLRVAGTTHGIDWAVSYYDGVETGPNFMLGSETRCATLNAAGTCGSLETLDSTGILTPRFDRIRLIGADAGFEVAGVTARLEAAFGMDRRLPRPTSTIITLPQVTQVLQGLSKGERNRAIAALLAGESAETPLPDLFVSRDTVQVGVGADYVWHGWQPIFQVNQTFVLDNDTKLLVPDYDTRLTFVLRKAFLSDTLATEVAWVQGLERSYTSGILRATYAITDDLRVRAGYLFLAGSRNTLIGEYKPNDEAFFQLRYSY